MNSCNHIGLFHLSGRDNFRIHHGNRTQYIIQEMTDADSQHPSMIFFIGAQSKDAALRELFPNNNIRRGNRNGIVNLRLDSSTISSDLPLLFADGDTRSPIPHHIGTTSCHEHLTVPFTWQPQDHDLLLSLYARLMAPFTDVICIFAADFSGLRDVASFLVRWVRLGSPSSLPIAVRPRVIIVVSEEDSVATHDVLELETFRHELEQESPAIRAEVFSSISIMHLAGDHVSPLARHRRLKEVLMAEVAEARNERIAHRAHFSAVHLAAFFGHGIDHVAHSIQEPFDFIGCTRVDNTIDEDYTNHVSNFLSLGDDYFVSWSNLTSFLASSILMDAYPSRMHSKSLPPRYMITSHNFAEFEPKAVFRQLYKPHCIAAITEVLNSPKFAEDMCVCIEEQIDLLFPAFERGVMSSAELHANNLKSHQSQWTQLRHHGTCIFCVRRKPEHILTCEHAICDACVVIFGSSVVGRENYFEIDSCMLCLTKGKLMARLKPKTAGARILSIDGGGVRGVVPLEFLGLLQGLLDADLELQDLFEQAFGTSSGE